MCFMKKAHSWIDPALEFYLVDETRGQWVKGSEHIDNSVVKIMDSGIQPG